MANSLFLVASLLLLVVPMSLATTSPLKDVLGDYKPIEDITNPNIQSLGQFAVTEHNKEAKTQLKFQAVTSGLVQTVAGFMYKLRLTGLDGTVSRTYVTMIFKDLSGNNHLTAFFGISN